MNGKSLGSCNSKSQSSLYLAECYGEVCPGEIRYFADVSLISDDEQINTIFWSV